MFFSQGEGCFLNVSTTFSCRCREQHIWSLYGQTPLDTMQDRLSEDQLTPKPSQRLQEHL